MLYRINGMEDVDSDREIELAPPANEFKTHKNIKQKQNN